MYATATGETVNFCRFLVDLIAGKILARRAKMVLSLAWLMMRANIPWILDSVLKRWGQSSGKQFVVVYKAVIRSLDRDFDGTRAIEQGRVLIRYTSLCNSYTSTTKCTKRYEIIKGNKGIS